MARITRFVVPDLPHHIAQRRNRRQQVFFSDDVYALYRDLLAESATRLAARSDLIHVRFAEFLGDSPDAETLVASNAAVDIGRLPGSPALLDRLAALIRRNPRPGSPGESQGQRRPIK